MIKTAAALHDIGKITTPEEILNKPGKLTAEEFEIMKDHAAAGARILEDMPYGQDKPLFRYALEICHWHHERWDGHGYPDGLWGEQIPISTQVVSLADVYDALTNERCYKKAIEQDTAIKMILNGECGAFNPLLLECLTEIAPQLRTTARRPAEAYPYWSEASRLSDEVLSQADMPKNERMQRLLESMQERIDFFASCNGGIEFEYDAISGLVDITDWDKPPQYRRSVKNVSHLEEFQLMGRKDIGRLQEAMEKTTKENPEFTMSMFLPCGEEKHWCGSAGADIVVRAPPRPLCGRRGTTDRSAAFRKAAADGDRYKRGRGGRGGFAHCGGDSAAENDFRCHSAGGPHLPFCAGIGQAGQAPSDGRQLCGILGQLRHRLRKLHFQSGVRTKDHLE